MNNGESSMYELGRQARRAGDETFACNVNNPIRRGFWLAGWHDEDIEMGNSRYFQNHVKRVSINEVTTGEAA